MYKALYRKYRPSRFEDIIGQKKVIETIRNEIKEGRIGHAYLLTGTRGTGKTSCAKIMAKAVNCEKVEEGEPCGTCKICEGIEKGKITDIVEIDAASNNGIDNIREIREEARYVARESKRRVYIIDEVHMLSIGAFNGLLKIMEEPPDHLIFILATTELEKVPITVRSRCQIFEFRKVGREEIEKNIERIIKEENIEIDKKGVEQISKRSGGGVRDSLTILERCIGGKKAGDKVVQEEIEEILGIMEEKKKEKMIKSILKGDIVEGLEILDELEKKGKEVDKICEEIVEGMREIMIYKVRSKGEEWVKEIEEEIEKISIEMVIKKLEIYQEVYNRMSRSSNKRIEMERGIIESGIENTECEKGGYEQEDRLKREGETNAKDIQDKGKILDRKKEIKIEARIQENKIEENKEKEKEYSKVEEWNEILEDIKEEDMGLYTVLKQSEAYEKDDKIYIIINSELMRKIINRKEQGEKLRETIKKVKGKEYKVMVKEVRVEKENREVDKIYERAKEMGIEVEEK